MTTDTIVLYTAEAKEAHTAFRAVLEAMARPGSIHSVCAGSTHEIAAHAVLRALADHEVFIAVPGDAALARRLAIATGARDADATLADYVLYEADPADHLLTLRRGLAETPEDGATAIVMVDAVGEGDLELDLQGPGVAGSIRLTLSGVSRATFLARQEVCSDYPLGIDLLFIDRGGRCAALPRTTIVTTEER